MPYILQFCVNKFNKILEIQLLDNKYVEFFRKWKFDYIIFEDSDYNNIYLKVSLNYNI